MKWNLENIRFLHPPDDFMGTFNNEKMQARHEEMQKQKIAEITSSLDSESHPYQAMKILNPKEHLKFLLNNLDLFKESDCFEQAVIYLFFRENTPFAASGTYEVWEKLFLQCDPQKAMQLGKPLPKSPVKAFRGSVTGVVKGLCYTIDPEDTAWVLERWADPNFGGGTVFELEIQDTDILIYKEEGRRKEVILHPNRADSMIPHVIDSL